jgi:hypothetical protein
MDVAVFVGFAAAGPLHQPVVIEGTAQFNDVFGRDLQLAWDTQLGQTANAYLGPAVRAFFAGGGRRCWVIRVADTPDTLRRAGIIGTSRSVARSNRFGLVGLIGLDDLSATWSQATLVARSVGSWSDGVQVSATALSDAVSVVGSWTYSNVVALAVTAPLDLVPGDLLRVTFPETGYALWLALDAVGASVPFGSPTASSIGQPAQWVTGSQQAWFSAAVPASWAPLVAARARLFDGTLEPADLSLVDAKVDSNGIIHLDLAIAPPTPPQVGALVQVDFSGGWARTAWLTIDEVRLGAPTGSPLSPVLTLSGTAQWWLSQPPGTFPPLHSAWAERFTLQLDVQLGFERWTGQADSYPMQLTDLGLLPAHPRFWGSLPDDAQLYGTQTIGQTALVQALTSPRFPVAGDGAAAILYIPLGAGGLRGAEPSSDTPLDRDGLTMFGADLFVDGDLASVGVNALLDEADFLRFQQPLPRALSGMHGALGLTEPALIAIPDAVHRGWVRDEPRIVPPPPCPPVPPVVLPDCQPPVSDPGFPGQFAPCDTEATSPVETSQPITQVSLVDTGGWSTQPIDNFSAESLLDIQQSVLTLCAAAGDLLSVLSLPAHYRDSAAIAHSDSLAGRFTYDRDRTLSFGAVYHPWQISRDDPSGRLLQSPPDGAMCGLIAGRTLARGAWVAPANQAMPGILALTPFLASERRLDLQNGHVNVIRQEPAGFLVLSNQTLSDDDTVRPINVRRLMSLLRRLVLREGANYVFEPNDASFRRLVQRSFEAVLDNLYLRGAFSGATPDVAYQVNAGPVLNTSQSVDSGRLIVELKVVPAQALNFLTIRLVNAGDSALRVVEG